MQRMAPLSLLLFFLVPGTALGAVFSLEQQQIDSNGHVIIDVFVETDRWNPLNAASAHIAMPRNLFQVVSVDWSDSIFDIWTDAPTIDRTRDGITFSGGTTGGGGFIFKGKVFSFSINPYHYTQGEVRIEDAQILAHDGVGTDILEHTKNLPYRHVRGELASRFDDNRDGRVSLRELSVGLVRERS